MLKRQDTLLSSSSRRETPPPEKQHAKSIGCMAGIFQFVSKYQRRRRKFLTFGKRQEKNSEMSTTKAKPLVDSQACRKVDGDDRRISCEVRRSPSLPAEIRRSTSPENFGAPPESASEKRKKLLGALEKCDEDLKALKKIIDAVQSVDHLRFPAAVKSGGANPWDVKAFVARNDTSEGNDAVSGGDSLKRADFNREQQPSSGPGLDEFTRSPLSCNSKRHTNGRMMQQQKPTPRKKPGEDDAIDLCFFNKVTTDLFKGKTTNTGLWSSKAMVESVDEVCKDIAWGEKREMGRIGLVLQDYICRDLIEEVVTELGCSCIYSLPLEACKRRLCF